MKRPSGRLAWLCALSLAIVTPKVFGQESNQRPRFQPPPPPVVSPEVKEDRTIVFRIRARDAETVRLNSSDIPNLGPNGAMKESESEQDVWEVTVGPVDPGAYRYHIQVDGLEVVDPANPATSESNSTTWSLVVVPGSENFDTKDVPHGAVAEVTYESKALGRPRRMHVYTPPGYESGEGKYPVFYLLHGASDSDDSWSTVGRAGFILDNLIAQGKAKPMIVVMPNGHTGRFGFGRGGGGFQTQMEEFVKDFNEDVKPYIEKNYRVLDGQANTAIAGLSMGGAQTIDIAIPNLDDYGYIGVYSSGIFGIAGGGGPGGNSAGPSWAERHKEELDNADAKKGVELFWFGTGKGDFLIETSRATVQMFKDHGFDVEFQESEGGHTWLNWRDYLSEFAPRLFQEKDEK